MPLIASAALNILLLFTLALAATGAEPASEFDVPLPGGGSMRMVRVDAGNLLMGNNGVEKGSAHWADEFPQHAVRLSAYGIGKYEVTRGQYRRFIEARGYALRACWSTDGWQWKEASGRSEPEFWGADQTWFGWRFTQTDDHPVTGVTYYEAEAFCQWAGGELPTEAQWEKAASWTGDASTVYPWGNEWKRNNLNGWYGDRNNERAESEPVGSYPVGASPYGCEDMAGNVWEWCRDWYQADLYAHGPAGGWTDPQGPGQGMLRVCRGGSLSNTSDSFRCAARSQLEPGRNWYTSGFRMVCPAP